jgi:ketosteroid isomerase-like protein
MSHANVDLVRRAYEAWNAGGSEAAKEFWSEDVELRDPPNLPDSRVVRGRDAVAAYLTDQVKVVGEMKVNPVEVRTRGAAVALRMKLTLHGTTSGVDVPGEMPQVVEVADGKVRRIRLFFAWEEALEAAGLSE